MGHIIYNKVNVVGTQWIHFFLVNGVEVKVPCTQKAYTALGVQGAATPSLPNGIWLRSAEMLQYDTVDGYLQEGDYAENGDAAVIMQNGKEISIPSVSVANGVVASDISITSIVNQMQ